MLLFDKLAEEARAAGFDDDDDRAPYHEGPDIIDVTDRGGDPVFPEIPFALDSDWNGDGAGDGDGGGEEGGEEGGKEEER